MKRKELTHLEDPMYGASSWSTSQHVGDYEGTTKKPKEDDYEVFLSFRGEDTRKGFTDYLYNSLIDVGIHTFRDKNELRIGEEIGPELLYSITQSKISIPIISENYASSKWCLCELVQMLKCKRSNGQVVLPIFYKVEPSQVRHLTERFGDAINAHKKNLGEMVVKEWEAALKEVSFLKGWESEKIDDGHEGTLVKIIVSKVISELKGHFQLSVPKELVGIDKPIGEIMSFIVAKFNATMIIGIYGMGGIGKTTLAKVLYNNLSSCFEHLSFVANIRETSIRKGIEWLQKQLIDDILRSLQNVSNVDDGICIIKSRFKSKKVLVLLDDMDDKVHLDALVGDGTWFKAGSLVIITTRNKSILNMAKAAYMYELNKLPLDMSLILFSRHAFLMDSPHNDYEIISNDIVSTAGGLPLALEVIGSFLHGKAYKMWEDTLKKLKKVPYKKVQDTLRISYDSLDYETKQIFLDIACFFIGSSKQSVTYMWDDCDFFPESGIEVLSLMSLIKIDEDGIIMMHDQLRDLGREIVRLKHPNEPQSRSRLWICEEALDVLDNNKGTSEIEALRLEHHLGKGHGNHGWKSYRGEQFNRLTNLRFLHVSGVKFTGDFQNSLPKLRWLQWTNCPSDFEATNFHPKKLVVLDLSESSISEDWGGWGPLKMATELKVLNLSSCCKLKRTPDLSTFKKLEILDFKHCTNLEEIHPSIGKLVSLTKLQLSFCRKLKRTPDLSACKKLEILDFAHCTNLEEIHPSIGKLVWLTKLQLWDSSITKLPESIGNLQKLRYFSIGSTNGIGITTLPESIGNLQSLETLQIGHIPVTNLQIGITTLPESIGTMQNLTKLSIRNAPVTELPSAVGMLANLQVLIACDCRNLKGLPSSIGELVSLKVLDLQSSGIRGLPESISKLSSLQHLDVQYCWNLGGIPEPPSSLTALHITFPTPSLPYLSKLTLLQKLTLSDLHPLECLPELPVRLSQVCLYTGWNFCGGKMERRKIDVEKMELRFSELIRDKSSGLRKVTWIMNNYISLVFHIE